MFDTEGKSLDVVYQEQSEIYFNRYTKRIVPGNFQTI